MRELAEKTNGIEVPLRFFISKWSARHFQVISPGRNAVEPKMIDSRPLRLLVNIRGKRYNERGSTPWIATPFITIR
jgi:hypothetical protein